MNGRNMGASFGNVPAVEPIRRVFQILPEVLAKGHTLEAAGTVEQYASARDGLLYWLDVLADTLDEMDENARGEGRAVLSHFNGVKP